MAAPVRDRVVLQKKEEAMGSKATGELGSMRLRTFQPGNGGVATAMIALTPGSDAQPGKKEEGGTSGRHLGIDLGGTDLCSSSDLRPFPIRPMPVRPMHLSSDLCL